MYVYKTEKQNYNTVGTVLKSNRKTVETENKSIP